MHGKIQPSTVFDLQRVETRIRHGLSEVSHPACRSEKSPFHIDSSSEHSRSAALLSLANVSSGLNPADRLRRRSQQRAAAPVFLGV